MMPRQARFVFVLLAAAGLDGFAAALPVAQDVSGADDECATMAEEQDPHAGCSVGLLQRRAKGQQALRVGARGAGAEAFEGASAGEPFCCYSGAVEDSVCSSCYPKAKAKPGTWCAKGEDACSGCGGTWCSGAGPSAADLDFSGLMRGISYGPSPMMSSGTLTKDDFFSDSAKPEWGNRGRGDLSLMRALGANSVRLYGNDAREDHSDFLDTAGSLGLGVMAGMSDYPFVQSADNCRATSDYDCSRQVRDAYAGNLQRGFLKADGTFHPALDYVIVINEPDLKLPNVTQPITFARGIATALDGMLDAEAEAGVVGPRPNFTVTFSFALCAQCKKYSDHPALAQMWTLRDALLNPASYGFQPKNNLAEVFHTRFTYSFNTANPSIEIPKLLLDDYVKEFPTTPVFIAEYHNPNNPDKEQDIRNMLLIAKKTPLLLGLSFFEYQVRYDEGGHIVFGMFDPEVPPSAPVMDEADEVGPAEMGAMVMSPGSLDTMAMPFFGPTFKVPCLYPVTDEATGRTVSALVAAAFGGPGIDEEQLCTPNPLKELVNEAGFLRIQQTQNPSKMATYLSRVVGHMGGDAESADVPEDFARGYSTGGLLQQVTAELLSTRPGWADWSTKAACVVDRDALKPEVASAVESACGDGTMDCTSVPTACSANHWDKASFVFGTYYNQRVKQGTPGDSPTEACFFGGAARIATSKVYHALGIAAPCVVPTKHP